MSRTRGRLLRRIVTLGILGGVLAYRRQRLDAADRAFPEAGPRSS
ncbi:MAG TPA: hypothetical protein VM262_16380 [Acidimicrobiales bacterium]|jgi:uncharacterized MnhB-related membrane protein|nr:hypothetical protein [Acidimicrobiales bacterium]